VLAAPRALERGEPRPCHHLLGAAPAATAQWAGWIGGHFVVRRMVMPSHLNLIVKLTGHLLRGVLFLTPLPRVE
jgi:hypothetical protein